MVLRSVPQELWSQPPRTRSQVVEENPVPSQQKLWLWHKSIPDIPPDLGWARHGSEPRGRSWAPANGIPRDCSAGV